MKNPMPSNSIFVASFARLCDYRSHHYPFQKAIEKITQNLFWDYKALISEKHLFDKLSPNWIPCLDATNFSTLYKTLSIALLQHLQPMKHNRKIIFLDSPGHGDVEALFMASHLLYDKNLHIWILLHNDPLYPKDCGKAVRICLERMAETASTIRLITPDLKLSQIWREYLSYPCATMPTPQCESLPTLPLLPIQKKHIILWFPGGLRKTKGLEEIQKIIQQKNTSGYNITIYYEKSEALAAQEKNLELIQLQYNLSDQEYLDMFAKCHAVLLPRYHPRYQYAVSGIFIEAMCMQKPAFANPNTSLARMLEENGLEKFIVDFSKASIWEDIIEALSDTSIERKLATFSKSLRAFHTLDRLHALFTELASESLP